MAPPTRYDQHATLLMPNQALHNGDHAAANARAPIEPASCSLSVVVPAFNEEKRLGNMLREATYFLQRRAEADPTFSWEIIVVDDGSADRTSDVGLRFSQDFTQERVRVLRLHTNCGKGVAVREVRRPCRRPHWPAPDWACGGSGWAPAGSAPPSERAVLSRTLPPGVRPAYPRGRRDAQGMLAARGRLMLMVDADGATRFADFEQLERHFLGREPPAEAMLLVAGSRAHLQSVKRSFYRGVLTQIFHFLVALAIGGTIKDTQCGFKLFGREAGKRLFSNLHVRRWAFDVELFFMASRLGIEVREEPVNWTEIPGSKMRVTGMLQMAKELLLIRCMYLVGVWSIS